MGRCGAWMGVDAGASGVGVGARVRFGYMGGRCCTARCVCLEVCGYIGCLGALG